jgi:hypothetical protein
MWQPQLTVDGEIVTFGRHNSKIRVLYLRDLAVVRFKPKEMSRVQLDKEVVAACKKADWDTFWDAMRVVNCKRLLAATGKHQDVLRRVFESTLDHS